MIVSVPVIGEPCCVPYVKSRFTVSSMFILPVYRAFFFSDPFASVPRHVGRNGIHYLHQSFKWSSFRLAMHARKLGSGLFKFISDIKMESVL